NSPSSSLLAVLEDQVGQIRLAQAVQEVRCSAPLAAIHPHVKRSLGLKAEAPILAIELVRRYPKICQNPRRLPGSQTIQHRLKLLEIGVHVDKPFAKSCQPDSCDLQALEITIQTNNLGFWRCFQYCFSMPAQANSAINEQSAFTRPQETQDFIK